VTVHIIGVGEAIVQDDVLEGEDMVPGGFSFHEGGVEDESAKA
jgi:hypothetical protein